MNNRVNYKKNNKRNHKHMAVRLDKLKVSFFICVIFFISFAAISGVSASGSEKEVDKQYRSVLISEGDTLWDIADEHNDKALSHMSNNEYIKEIESINKINSDNITAGNYVIVPVFVAGE